MMLSLTPWHFCEVRGRTRRQNAARAVGGQHKGALRRLRPVHFLAHQPLLHQPAFRGSLDGAPARSESGVGRRLQETPRVVAARRNVDTTMEALWLGEATHEA